MASYNRGIAIVTYNRANYLKEIIEAVKDTAPDNCRIVLADDGSVDNTLAIARNFKLPIISGPNLGVAANKNRALWGLQDCKFLALIEDDILPVSKGWFEIYEQASIFSGIQHFCRVQDKEVPETIFEFSQFLVNQNYTPIYGPSPRGDFTFLTKKVLDQVGAFHPGFRGAGYAHGEWTERVVRAGLIGHPNKYVDIKEARDMLIQKGDREGGRWTLTEEELKLQLRNNRQHKKKLDRLRYIHHPLVLM